MRESDKNNLSAEASYWASPVHNEQPYQGILTPNSTSGRWLQAASGTNQPFLFLEGIPRVVRVYQQMLE